MGRTPTISREALLDLADEIVRQGGGGALTIGALAQAAGISKEACNIPSPARMPSCRP